MYASVHYYTMIPFHDLFSDVFLLLSKFGYFSAQNSYIMI